ncbi:MAG: hypothetical protein JW818_08405 [Pirellulales bacterium]|nr:hypothetical protein [Pirellulales bacterium]
MSFTSVMPPHSKLTAPSSADRGAGHGEHGAPIEGPSPNLPPPLIGLNLSGCLHALRRHWLAAMTLGLFCGMVSGATTWLVRAPRYTAVSLVRIAEKEPSLVFGGRRGSGNGDFGVYKRTQQQLLLSLPILKDALQKPEIAQLPLVRSQRAPVTWLTGALMVRFPDGAEVMRVSLEGKNPQDLIDIVNSVVDTYMDHVRRIECEEQEQRLADLDRIYAEKQAEARERRTALINMTRHLESTVGGNRSPKHDATLRQLVELKRELYRHEFEIKRKQSELAAHTATVNTFTAADVADVELDTYAQSDAEVIRLRRQLEDIRLREARTRAVVRPSSLAPFAERHSRAAAMTEELLQERFAELREQLARSRRATALDKVRELRTQIGILAGLKQQLEEDLNKQRSQIQDGGESPGDLKMAIDVEMNRAELDQLDQLLSRIAGDREKLKIESEAASRVIVVQPAQVLSGGDRQTRWFVIMLMATLGASLPIGCIVVWDVRKQLVNSPADVLSRSGLTVLGVMPTVSSSAVGYGAVPAEQPMADEPDLIQCVDNMIVALLHDADREGKRVILVCSAAEDEGKTTVAIQLALGFARTGHRTALVDFDLRHPALNKQFGLAAEPGVAEVLRGESEAIDTMQGGVVENLWLLTSGRHDSRAQSALAQGEANALFDHLRAMFDFVVVLGGPIVPAADTRLLSHSADAVIFSIQRYQSRVPNVSAACRILAALGVRVRDAVVTDTAASVIFPTTRHQACGLPPFQPSADSRPPRTTPEIAT